MAKDYSEDELVEKEAMRLFQQLGWDTALAYNKETFGAGSQLGRLHRREVVLKRYFLEQLAAFNPGLPASVYQDAYTQLTTANVSKTLAEINFAKYQLLRDGIPVDYEDQRGRLVRNKKLRVFDFAEATNNHFLAVQQLWVEGKSKRARRPDIICFVNGIPLIYIELKNPAVNVRKAYDDNYSDLKDVTPHLFYYNAVVILSNGRKSKIGSITSAYHHFHEWKRITEADTGTVDLDRIILGVCNKERLLDLFENFILYDDSLGDIIKLVARNHQFIGVNKAIANIKHKEQLFQKGKISREERQKLGVFWHTQGSGKSYSMVFFAQKLHRKMTGSYTFLVVTDRSELDSQIYGTFSGVRAVPQIKAGKKAALKASSGKHLRKLLGEEHRYLFTLIHKFNFTEEITQRDNIIVISDEAHRTQGGTLAMNLRRALPNAAFIGFTGTPLFKDDELTKRIFGDYVSRYDFKRSVEDGATVPLYYANRGELLKLDNPTINADIRAALDAEAEDLDSDERQKIEQLFAREYPILTAKKRLDAIAKDMVWHFCNRGYQGKGMYIALDKLTAVRMYDLISHHWAQYVQQLTKAISKGKYGDQELLIKKRELEWIKATEICVVVSSEQNEIKRFAAHDLDIEPHRAKMNEQDLETRFKDENDPFRLVIVCAMWITGFDVPTLSTLYLDKPLKSHTLMQAIARANRISEGKNNGLIVDYIETYTSLLDALAIYGGGETGGNDEPPTEQPVRPQEELIAELEEALTATETFLREEVHFNLQELIDATGLEKLAVMERGMDAVYTNDETKRAFQILSRAVFRKYKALQPEKVLYQYKPRRDAINVIYQAIEDNVESADVTEIMRKIQQVVDDSIENRVAEPRAADENLIDLSGLNFELLEKHFLKTKRKNSVVQSLKEKVEQQLQRMVDRNPLTINFYNRYQEIINDYNLGKDEVVIQETFRKLIELVNSYTAEQAETQREGLTDEQKAVFDILRLGKKLESKDKKLVKQLSVELLEELKKEKLQVEHWADKSTTAAAVFAHVNDVLFQKLPVSYELAEIESKTQGVYQHLRNQYYGGGLSIYGTY